MCWETRNKNKSSLQISLENTAGTLFSEGIVFWWMKSIYQTVITLMVGDELLD